MIDFGGLVTVEYLGKAEVGELYRVALEQDIRRLQITVADADALQEPEGLCRGYIFV